MDCAHIRKNYDPTDELSLEMIEHLDGCRICRSYAQEIQQLRSWLRTDPPVMVPPAFNLQLQRRLDQVRRNPLNWWKFLHPMVAVPLAAMLVVMISSVLWLKRSPDLSLRRSESLSVNKPTSQTETPVPIAEAEKTEIVLSDDSLAAVETAQMGAEMRPVGLTENRSAVGSRLLRAPVVESSEVFLLVFDEVNQRERLITIPAMLVGAKPVFASTQGTQKEVEHVF